MKLEIGRIRMVMELRRNGITDPAVLAAIEGLPREAFVPAWALDRAYDDTALPIDCGQTISQPTVVGLMSQALRPDRKRSVLEIGTGSGYQTAVLCRLFRRVYSVEIHKPLSEAAAPRLDGLKLRNVTLRVGDGGLGWPEAAPFDRILAAAAAPHVPGRLADQLAVGGVLVLPVGEDDGEQTLVRVVRSDAGFVTESLGSVRFVPFVGTARTESAAPLAVRRA